MHIYNLGRKKKKREKGKKIGGKAFPSEWRVSVAQPPSSSADRVEFPGYEGDLLGLIMFLKACSQSRRLG